MPVRCYGLIYLFVTHAMQTINIMQKNYGDMDERQSYYN
jgi:hypothetical protein